MSDKKTSADIKNSADVPSTSEPFDQEFEKFLREEAARVGAIYRKLPHAEPDAQLDARVLARAREGVREEPSFVSSRRIDSASRRSRRWVPAFASAAVLLLAAGIAWRLGPQNWARKDGVAIDATVVPKEGTPPADVPSPAAASTTGNSQVQEAEVASNAAASTAASAPSTPRDNANTPAPFPASKPTPRVTTPAASGGAAPDAARADLAQAETAHSETAGSRAPESAASTREKAAPENTDFLSGKLKKAEAREQSSSAPARSAAQPKTALSPAPASPASEPVTAPFVTAAPAPSVNAFEEKRRRDEPPAGRAQQGAAADVDRSTAATAQTRITRPPPPAAPPPAQAAPTPSATTGFAPEPETAVTAPPAPRPSAASPPASANRLDAETQKQQFAYSMAPPSDSPNLSISGRPTAAQLAAWPAPNCSASAAGTLDNRTWHYPPDVPATAQLRIATVRNFLNLDSREAARRAYADFRHCYPDDRWPSDLIQQLGTR